MKKALIITYYWPPAGGSGVQRWLKFVKYFRDFGVEPVVFTVKNPQYPILDKSLQNEIPKGVEILKQPIWEPNNIVSFIVKKNNETVGFLNPNPSVFGKLAQYIRANYFIPDARKFWIKPSVKYLKNYLSKNEIDVIITTGPPHSTHLIGLKLKQKLAVKWVADFRDPWTEIDYFHQLPLTKKSIKKHKYLEKEVLNNADAVIVVGDTMKKNYSKFNKNVITVTNGFDSEIVDTKGLLDTKFTMTHIGLMNADRNPEMLWKVLAEISTENKDFAKDFELKLIGKIAPDVNKAILVNNLGNNIHLIDYIPHDKVIEFQKKSQLLLLVVNNVPSAKAIITGKVFEYLMAKRPILAIAPINGDLAEIIKRTNSGFVVGFDDEVLLKKTILDLYSRFKQQNLEINSKKIEQFHRRELTKKVSKIINSITK
ncbi:glycosyltransferase family 4 protein [Lutibacter sp.]|uniref:glycosyltransferase family 4 protein n=1 Tax=Lutibacter sp. TaxID=1925666 RepID=UPI0025BF82B0|nr:glycosyltransferase family 4 protein [Lutibacter sp.]MCF6167810.1 glycosyltransferase family 4 protein [Lutibacter sp.]